MSRTLVQISSRSRADKCGGSLVSKECVRKSQDNNNTTNGKRKLCVRVKGDKLDYIRYIYTLKRNSDRKESDGETRIRRICEKEEEELKGGG